MSSIRASLCVALSALALTVPVFVGACASTHGAAGVDNPGVKTGRLASVNPLDVVVLTPDNLTGRSDLPLEALRTELQAGLIERRYSPLAFEYIDRTAIEASYRPGTLGEQAVFQVVITGWDDSLWRSHARLIVDADVYLLDAAAPERESALWGGHVTRRIDLATQRSVTMHMDLLLQRAVADLTDGILSSLPARNPERAN